MRRAVVDVYRGVFSRLECEHVLDPDNDVDSFCLQEVFVPRINRSLTEFVHSWHNHPISSERNMTPLQLRISYWLTGSRGRFHDQCPLPTTSEHVHIPNIPYIACTALKSYLYNRMNTEKVMVYFVKYQTLLDSIKLVVALVVFMCELLYLYDVPQDVFGIYLPQKIYIHKPC